MLDNDFKNTDFLEQAKNGSFKPPVAVWDRIEQSLTKKKKKRVFWWWFSGVAIGVVLAGFAIQSFNNKINSKKAISINSNSLEELRTDKHIISSNLTQDTSQLMLDVQTQLLAQQHIKQKKKSKVLFKGRNIKQIKQPQVYMNSKDKNSQLNGSISTYKNDDYEKKLSDTSASNIEGLVTKQKLIKLIEDTIVKLYHDNQVTDTINIDTLLTVNEIIADSLKNDTTLAIKDSTKKKKNYGFNLRGGLIANMGNIKEYNDQHHSLFGRSFGASAGIEYVHGKNQVYIPVNYRRTYLDVNNFEMGLADFNAQNAPITPVIPSPPTDTSQSTRYLIQELEVGMGYNRLLMSRNKWNLYIGANATTTIFNNISVAKEPIHKMFYFTDLNVQVDTRLQYNVNDKFGLYINPNFTKEIYNIKQLLIEHKNIIGIGFGINWRL